MPTLPPQRDVFPRTMRTWLGEALASGGTGAAEAKQHVMRVYAWPLSVYFRGSSFRWLGEADDMVQGFFADRLTKDQYLERWMSSGRQLRFWLIGGFKHYLLEQTRARKPRAMFLADAVGAAPESARAGGMSDADDPERQFERESARCIVAEALRRAQTACTVGGLDAHWRLFVRHAIDGAPYQELADESGVTNERAVVMFRTASNKFRAALRDLLAWPGARQQDVDLEIASLLEELRP